MKKIQLLRDFLTAAYPDFATNPESLSVFLKTDTGNIVATGTNSLSFEYRYTAVIVITDFPDSPDVITVPVIAWLKHYQPDLFQNPSTQSRGFRFDVDVLNHQTCDIGFELDLTESVRVKGETIDGQNRLTTYHVGEPILAGPGTEATPIDLDAQWQITPLVQDGS